jgi:hypothetical protein
MGAMSRIADRRSACGFGCVRRRASGFASSLCLVAVCVAVPLWLGSVRPALGALGDCGQPRSSGSAPSATDALEILKTAVGASDCGGFDPCICDVIRPFGVTATDALRVLQKAVGLDVSLACSCGITTTTTTLPEPVLTSEMMVLVRLQGGYATADLAGTWELQELVAGPDGPWWGRGALTISSNGSFSGTISGSDGINENIAGKLALSSGGLITCTQNCGPSFSGALDSGKSFAAATDTEDDGTAVLLVMSKRASSYSQSNMTGTWVLHGIETGPSAPWWYRGPLTIASNGAITGSIESLDGTVDAAAGTLSLSGNGRVTCTTSGCPNAFRGALDSGKTVVVATAIDDDGSTELAVVAKRGASYAQSNLTGSWRLNSIATGQAEPWWSRGTLSIAANGSLSGSIADIDGAMSPADGTLTIAADGIVTMSGDSDFACAMDADKTVVVCTDSW